VQVAALGRLDRGDESLRWLKQLGVDHVVVSGKAQEGVLRRFPPEAGARPGTHWEFLDLLHLRRRVEDAGLHLVALENPLPPWCYDRVMLGLPGAEVQLENLAATVRHAGRAGIPVLGYHWMVNPPGVARASYRTSMSGPGRGGARVAEFDQQLAARAPRFRGRVYEAEELWGHYERFTRAILPVAEEAGVRLALHPDDPPVAALGGVARLFGGPAGFRRAQDLAGSSPAWGLNLCLANWWAMGTDVAGAIAELGRAGRICYVHAQGVQGTVPAFRECFVDESECDYLEALAALRAAGFDGGVVPGHFPELPADDPAGRQSQAFAVGYLRGLIRAVERYRPAPGAAGLDSTPRGRAPARRPVSAP
jgi:mannonate dehydratase